VEVETATESEFKGGIANFGSARRLKIYRPERTRDLPTQATFVHEVGVEGTPVCLPVKEQSEVPPGITGLTVWVFEPLGPEIGFIDSEPDGS
jgi:hypothetical protein